MGLFSKGHSRIPLEVPALGILNRSQGWFTTWRFNEGHSQMNREHHPPDYRDGGEPEGDRKRELKKKKG